MATRYDGGMDAARLYDLLERLGNLVRVEDRAAAAAHGLQPVHVQALHFLARCNRYSDTPLALADWLGATKGTVSQSVQRLLARRLVVTRKDASDRRRVHLSLTERGAALHARLVPSALLRGLDAAAETPADAEAVLATLLLALQRTRGGRAFGVCRTCHHFQRTAGSAGVCGLTGEPLAPAETRLICREHDPSAV